MSKKPRPQQPVSFICFCRGQFSDNCGETANHSLGVMQIAPEQGQFMALLIQLLGTTKVLKLGYLQL